MEGLANDVVGNGAVEAAVDHRLVKHGQGAGDAGGRPHRELAGDGGLALEKHRRAGALDDRFDGRAVIEGGARLLEEIEVTQRGAGDDEARRSRRQQPAIATVEGSGVAERHGVDGLVNGEGGRVANDGTDIVDGDGVVAGGVEAELGDLAAADEAVGADQALQGDAGVGRDGEMGGGRLLVDDAVEVAVGIGVAGNGGGAVVLLAQAAERRGLAQLAGGDHHPGIHRRGGEQRLDGGLDGAVAGQAERDDALAAEERHGVGLVDEAAGIAGERVGLQAHARHRIVAGDRAGEGFGALRHGTLVGPVDEHDAAARVGLREEAVGVGGFDGGHDVVRPATECDMIACPMGRPRR